MLYRFPLKINIPHCQTLPDRCFKALKTYLNFTYILIFDFPPECHINKTLAGGHAIKVHINTTIFHKL